MRWTDVSDYLSGDELSISMIKSKTRHLNDIPDV